MALYHFTMKSDRKPNGDKIMADGHADYNGRTSKYQTLDNNETDSNTDAIKHSDYINRDAEFAEKVSCIYKAHHLPKWVNENPKEFFAAATAHEESEHTYKEFEFALQNELTFKQNLEITQIFAEKNFSDYSIMPEIQKLFTGKKVKSTLTKMANKITLGNIAQKKKVEELQKTMMETIERIRSVLATRIRLVNEQAIAKRLHDHLHSTQEIQRRKAERRYTALEIHKTIYDVLAAIRAEKQTLERELISLQGFYIFAPRAKKTAVDVYTKNQTKDLRELNRAIEKKKNRLQKAEDSLLKKQYALLQQQKPKWYENVIESPASKRYAAVTQEIQEENIK